MNVFFFACVLKMGNNFKLNLESSGDEDDFEEIEDYESESDEKERQEEPIQRGKKRNLKWIQFATFLTAAAVQAWLATVTVWSFFYTNITQAGRFVPFQRSRERAC